MGFDRRSKAFLKLQSRGVAKVGTKAVFTNYFRDARIPDERATHCSDYIEAKYSKNLWAGLNYYTANNIRNTRKAGFVDGKNNLNRLGTPGALPGRRVDCEYGRVLNLSQRPFYEALISGCQFLVSPPKSYKTRRADPEDFDLLPGAACSATSEKDRNFKNYYTWIVKLANQPLTNTTKEFSQLLAAYNGYVLASEDSENSGVYPYEPAWITPWEAGVQAGLNRLSVESWCLALGVDSFPKPGDPANVVALLKYRIPPAYVIYRPTALEAGCYALHYPNQADGGADSGRTMHCGAVAHSPPLKEWIHLQCPLELANLVSLQILKNPFPDLETGLTAWRSRHFDKLRSEYPMASIPIPRFI